MSCAGWTAGGLALFGLYVGCLPGGFYFEDGPELLACAATLGNTHEPGYPLHALLGRLALLVPAGGPAFRMNAFTAACGAGAAVLLGMVAAAIVRAFGLAAAAPWAGLFAAGVWGLSDAAWWEAVIGDKYAPWYLGIMAVMAAALGAGTAEGEARARRLLGTGLVAGLTVALHPYGVFAMPVVVWAFLAGGPPWPRGRTVMLAVTLLLLPVSVRILYPPVRSAGGAVLDWAQPRTAGALTFYVTARRYHQSFADTAPGRSATAWGRRLVAGGRHVGEEFPWVLLLGALPGVVAFARAAPGLGTALAGVAALNAAFVLTTPEKVVRWYEPAYACLLLAAAAGWAVLAGRLRRFAAPVVAVLALAAVGWQGARGLARNRLDRNYAAPDFVRNLCRVLPPRAVYLGRGDGDLFPLWAARFALGWRPDVEAVGMGTIVDAAPADVAGLDRLGERLRIWPRGWDALRWMLDPAHGAPVWFAKTGFDERLWTGMQLTLHRAAGVAARWTGTFDGPGSQEDTARFVRGATLRGLAYAPAGGVFDLARPRDEVSRDALLHYAFCFQALGIQLEHFTRPRMAGLAALCYRLAIRCASPLCGGIAAPGMSSRTRVDALLMLERAALMDGYTRLALLFEARGVAAEAAVYRGAAAMLAPDR